MAETPADNQEDRTTLGEAAAAAANPGSAQAAMTRQKMLTGATIAIGGLMSAIIAVAAFPGSIINGTVRQIRAFPAGAGKAVASGSLPARAQAQRGGFPAHSAQRALSHGEPGPGP